MDHRKIPGLAGVILAALFILGCWEAVGPQRRGRRAAPSLDATAAPSIALDQLNGTFNESGTVLVKGFNPTNPHNGDAIVATFSWLGSTNIIDSVTDVLATTPFTRVGNKYTLLEYVTGDGISMATYVAINVQNFPDGVTDPTGNQTLAVAAYLSQSVTDGGLLLSAWSGVAGVFAQAVGAHGSASGSGATATVADPGAISVGTGALVYAVTLANGLVGHAAPAGFTNLATQSNTHIVDDAEFAIEPSARSVDPQWTWFFTSQSTWLATVLALNPPPVATHLAFVVQPTDATAGSTISPAVQVAAEGDAGTIVATFSNPVTVALGTNPSGGTLSGTLTATPLNGVATFSDLSIDRAGNGYTLQATAAGVAGATSSPFNILAPPPPPATDFMTGGGKLGSGRDFATFGLKAGPSGGKVTWVQHCLKGTSSTSSTCGTGQFTFKGAVTASSYAAVAGQPTCRTWSGSGTRTNKNNPSASGVFAFTVNAACDNGQPGRGVDFIDITIGDYHASGFLTGGNLQLHRGS